MYELSGDIDLGMLKKESAIKNYEIALRNIEKFMRHSVTIRHDIVLKIYNCVEDLSNEGMERGQHYFAQEEFEEGQDVFEKVHHELKKRCKDLLKISLGQRKTNRTLKKMMDKKKRKNLELEKAHEAAKEKAMEDKVEFTAVLQLKKFRKKNWLLWKNTSNGRLNFTT